MVDAPTFLTRLTPAGTGAIAVLALEGPSAWEIVRTVFRPKGSRGGLPDRADPGQVWVGDAGTDEMADECVLVVETWEPVPQVELHCHGGWQVVSWLSELLLSRGATLSDSPLRSSQSLWRLVEVAPTVRTAAILLDQAQGAWEREMEAIESAWRRGDREEVRCRVQHLENWGELGRHLVQPYRVVVAGAPNVGKSSLVNAVAGYQRSIVAPLPGTTRDVLVTQLAIDGWPIELVDTAGWHPTVQPLERLAIERAQQAAASADLVLWVFDAALPEPAWPRDTGSRLMLVANKCDLPVVSDVPAEVRVSALTGEGIPELLHRLVRRLVPREPNKGEALPVLSDQFEMLKVWRSRLANS